jgi:hypothetical protein
VTERATVGESRPERAVSIEVANAVAFIGALPLQPRKFPLEKLSPAAHRTEGIAVNDENGGARRHHIATSGPNFVLKRLSYSHLGGVWRLCAVG